MGVAAQMKTLGSQLRPKEGKGVREEKGERERRSSESG